MKRVLVVNRSGYFTGPVVIILALIVFFVAITIFINAYFARNVDKESVSVSTPSPIDESQSR